MLTDQIKYVRQSWEDIVFMALVVLAAGLLMFELTALFSTPIPDSYLWWGDESWLMSEFKAQILTGHFHHPYALASTLEHGSGPVFSNMWITALLYGGIANLFKSTDPIILGRAITTLLATGLVFAIYEIVRKLTNERLLAIFAVILLISSRSFYFTSHSARYDILTAAAIAVSFFALLSHKVETPFTSLIAGALCAAGLLITVHVTIALCLTGLVAVLFDAKRKPLSVLAYGAGFITIVGLILIMSSLLHSSGDSTSSGFALNIRDIPALRIYSRSVQFANIMQRLAEFRSLAVGYLIVVAALLLGFGVHVIRNRSLKVSRAVWLVLALLCSWLEFESAAPTSYLIYILPILTIAVALSIQALLPRRITNVLIPIVTILLILFAIRDDWHARSIGKQLSVANDEALSGALTAIEQDTTHPLVLTFNLAVHRVVMDSSIRLMTTQFIEYSSSDLPVDSVIKSEHVRWVMLYRSTLRPDYMREVAPITDASRRLGVLVWERAGFLTDIGRSYFEKGMTAPDTLQVYRIRD